jgi:hypothetical protein
MSGSINITGCAMNDPTANANQGTADDTRQDGKNPVRANLTEAKPENIDAADNRAKTHKKYPIERVSAW